MQPPFCTAGVDCGNPVAAQLFFCVFIMVIAFMFISVVAAIIMQQVAAHFLLIHVGQNEDPVLLSFSRNSIPLRLN